jgi:uncharacterized repeat protein (TIGR01451 family)
MFMKKTRLFMILTVVILSLSLVGTALSADNYQQINPPIGGGGSTASASQSEGGDSLAYPEKGKPEELQGAPIPLRAGITGVSTDYGWSQTSGTYTEITGGTQVTTSCDDTSYNNYTIPFSFTFNGTAYTAVSIQCNGFIAMGATVVSSYTPISSGSSNQVVSALGNDLQTGTTNSEIRYETLGTTPNQIFVIQWKNFRHYSGSQIYNFQIRLYETSNVVEVVYGSFTENSSYTHQIGLRGTSNADFNNRSGTTGWTNTVAGTLNTASVTLSSTYYPPSGLTWDWTPIPPHPVFDTSYKTAPAQAVVGDSLAYVVHIINSGTDSADEATMVDPIPAGTIYNNDVTCSSGTCGFDGTNVTWAGTIAIAGEVTVGFSVDTDGLPCGSIVVNEATLDDPDLFGGPVTRSASTTLVSSTPAPLDGFEVSVPPPGWTETIVYDPGTDPDWSQVNVGTYPTINPHGGTYMAKFNSFNTGNGGSARLWTGALDLSGYAAPQVVFWMSHDTGYTTNADRLQIQVSTDGITWVDVGAPINRYDASCTTACWKEHRVMLPAGYDINGVYIGFLGISAYGNNFYLDDTALSEAWYPCPTLTIGPDQNGSSCPSSSISYPLAVQNISPMTDTVDITPLGATWPTSVNPSVIVIGPAQSTVVTLTVDVPWDAVYPDTDSATILAVGEGSGLSDTALINTSAKEFVGWANNWLDVATGVEADLYWGHSYYYDGNVCVVGGLAGSGTIIVSGEHHCYNIATSTWFDRASMPTALFAGAYGLIDGKFYIAGGFDINFLGYNNLQIYDPSTDTWSVGTVLPTARGGAAGGVVNGKLYSAGGSGTSSFPVDCPTYEYDPVADTWASLASCPLQGGYGFDLGGSVGSDYLGLLFAGGHFGAYYGWYAFDPVANAWQTLSNLPYHKTPLIVENPNTGDIYSISGFIGWTAQNATWKYDYVANTWTNLSLPQNTTQGGALGPAHGSFGDPDVEGFWSEGGSIGSGALSPAPFELWEYGTFCAVPEPDIDVNLPVLEQTLLPDQTATLTGPMCNVGTAPLDWNLWEVPAPLVGSMPFVPVTVEPSQGVPAGMTTSSNSGQIGIPTASENPEAVLWDQPLSTVNQGAYVNQEFTDFPTYSAFLADDFHNPNPWSITTIFVPGDGWNGFTTLFNATALTWQIYADNAGVPAGDPAGGGNPPIWTLTLPPTDPQVIITTGTPGGYLSNAQLNLAVPLILPPGDYWLVFYPTLNFGLYGQFGRQPSDTTYGYTGQFVNPGGGFGFGTVWQSWNVIGAPGQDIAFRLEGDIIDIPWLSENPTYAYGQWMGVCIDVDVTFDSTGLALGEYYGNLQIDSNDPDEPSITLPVTLTVVAPPDIEVLPPALSAVQFQNETTTQTLNINNLGDADLVWNIFEETGAPLVYGPPLPNAPQANTDVAPVSRASITPLALGDWLFDILAEDATGNNLLLGVEFANGHYWVTGGEPSGGIGFLYKIDTAGNLVATYNQASACTGWGGRDLVFDGTYLYYGCDDGLIHQVDPATGLPTGVTITSPIAPPRALAYDPATDHFWTANWDSNLYEIERNGTIVHSFAPVGLSTYGMAWDDWSTGGPFLWLWSQDGPDPLLLASQVDPTTGLLTGVSFLGNGVSGEMSGGATISDQIVPGLVVFVGMNQGLTDRIGVYDMGIVAQGCDPSEISWLSTNPISGTTPGGGSSPVEVTFDSTGLAGGDYFADLCVESNDPDEPNVIVPISMTVNTLAITLDKTVGTVPGVCATTDAITVPTGTTVYYCYTVTNNSTVALNTHDLYDTVLGQIFTGNTQPLDPNESYSYIADPYVANATVTNTGTWTAYADPTHSTEASDTATVTVFTPESDLAVVKSDNADPVLVGDFITYTLVVTNYGPDATTGVLLTDTLPISVTFVSADAGCTHAAGVVTCDIGDLAVDGSVTLHIVVTAEAVGTATNTAEVSSANTDPDPLNNIASEDTLINPSTYYFYLPIVQKH